MTRDEKIAMLEAYIAAHRNHLLHAAARYAGWASAEDVAQDACIKALRFIDRFDPTVRGVNSIKAWMTTIVSNCAKDHVRVNRKRERSSAPIDAECENIAHVDAYPIEWDHSALVEKLPDMHQVVIRMLVAGATYDDVGAELGLPPSTVKSVVHRARNAARAARDRLATAC